MKESRNSVWELVFPSYIRNLFETLEKEQVAIEPFLERHNLHREFSRLPDNVEGYQRYMEVVADVLATQAIEGLGLKTGKRLNLSDHGLLGYAINSCENLHKALDVFCHFSPIVGGYSANLHIDLDNSEASLEYINRLQDLREEVLRYQLEESFTAWHCIAHKWADSQPWFSQVHFEFSPPSYAKLYRDHFHCPVLFNQPHNRFFFATKYLTLPFVGYSEQLFSLTIAQCTELLAEMPKLSATAEEVRAILARCTGRFPSLEEVSQYFNVSTATMRRRLAKEGTNYQQLLKAFRMQLACRYLTETGLSVNEIAYLTGYNDPANFNRAFRSFQRQSPQKYRLSHQV